MAKVLGLGGIFFKSDDPGKLGAWYGAWLGLDIDASYSGTHFPAEGLPDGAYSVWGPFHKDTAYFAPSDKPFMFNLIVDDLAEALEQVRQGGATVHGEPEALEYGLFGWFTDPEGNKVELWQPEPGTGTDEPDASP